MKLTLIYMHTNTKIATHALYTAAITLADPDVTEKFVRAVAVTQTRTPGRVAAVESRLAWGYSALRGQSQSQARSTQLACSLVRRQLSQDWTRRGLEWTRLTWLHQLRSPILDGAFSSLL